MKKKKVILAIIDGWGLAEPDKFNAINNANTPNIDRLIRDYPNTRLKSDGPSVGLPEGQFGTSEVNHLTIGAGRVILQDLPKINRLIETGDFFLNSKLNQVIDHVKNNNSALNLIGILSDGKVHAYDEHLFALIELVNRRKLTQRINLHLFTDGRDVAPKSLEKYFSKLDKVIKKYPELDIQVASLQGRYYLDRDRDWDKTTKAVKCILGKDGLNFSDWEAVKNYEYNQNNSDEYFANYIIAEDRGLNQNDGVIFFHFRTDRLFQLVQGLIQEELENLKMCTFIQVSEEFKDVLVAFPRDEVKNTLAEVLSKHNLTQLHVTETEKYAHLTYFLNGEREVEFPKEDWHLIESNRYVKPHYSFEPSMRNFDIAKRVVDSIEKREHDFVVINFSSPDMVGHTGNYEAAVVSAESVDYCIGKIYDAVEDILDEYTLLITSDHGNSDIMWDYKNNQPHTQHTTSPVPFIFISNKRVRLHRRDTLADVAPTILEIMGLEKPAEMTGESLIIKG